ncbi:MAG TPA: copper-binding protein [Candidatus Elarobacter sp.]|nr:copper-binding protein [Candidatus Elarobacter sp.]
MRPLYPTHMRQRLLIVLAAVIAAAAAQLTPAQARPTMAPMPGMAPAARAASTREIHGTVHSVVPALGLLSIHHDAMPGMAAMTMVVKLKDHRQLKGLHAGDAIRLRCNERVTPYLCEKL